jgi:Domain of unknown function (DUF4158)
MPVDFLTEEQLRRYGRYASEPTAAQLERYFHLDDADRGLIARCRTAHTRLGFAVQLGTVRFLGTFLANPAEVPPGVVAYLARQLGIAEAEGLGRYAAGEKRWDHAAAIRRHYGYRDFHKGTEAAASPTTTSPATSSPASTPSSCRARSATPCSSWRVCSSSRRASAPARS